MEFWLQLTYIEMDDLPRGFGRHYRNYHLSIRCTPFEALYGRKYRSPVLWAEIGESSLIGPELVQETTDKVVLIKEKLKATRDHQKSYADNKRKPLEFELAPRYVEPFEILERIGSIAYRLRLLEELSSVHDTFHVLKKICLADASLYVPLDEIKVDKTLHFVEELVENSDREIKRLKCSRMVVVKGIDGLLVVSVIVSLLWIVDSERDRLIVVDRGTRSVPLFVMLSVTVSTWFVMSTQEYIVVRSGCIKNHKKTVKNGQTRTRETEEYKRAKDSKPKSKKECHVDDRKAQSEDGFYSGYTHRTSTNITSMDCQLGNLCEFVSNPRAKDFSPMIDRKKG
ncbi:hypothetical protein Tco_1346009 [Tanacetum coccineum]